jgi:hypothetical protein
MLAGCRDSQFGDCAGPRENHGRLSVRGRDSELSAGNSKERRCECISQRLAGVTTLGVVRCHYCSLFPQIHWAIRFADGYRPVRS